MSAREIAVDLLVGRRVRDAAGRTVGRIEELICEIELHERGRHYVVRQFRIGTVGRLDALTGNALVRGLLRTIGRTPAYRQFVVGWERVDLTEPERPVLRYAISTST